MIVIHSTMQDRHSIVYGGREIVFQLLRTERTTIGIEVHPDSSVVVKAPHKVGVEQICQKVRKRARWILRQQRFFRQFVPRTPPRAYVGGETHLYLGKQYRLRVLKGADPSVKLKHGYFYISCRTKPAPGQIKELMDAWYLAKAKQHAAESLQRCWRRVGLDEHFIPQVTLRRMSKRWGSLSSKGRISLNPDLIRAPRICLDYVITHELCHLRFHDHSPGFFELLTRAMPDWQSVKSLLEHKLL